jgi:hypothetical protein
VTVKLKGLVEGRVFDERTVEWELGEGLEQGVPRGLELAIEKLKVRHNISGVWELGGGS